MITTSGVPHAEAGVWYARAGFKASAEWNSRVRGSSKTALSPSASRSSETNSCDIEPTFPNTQARPGWIRTYAMAPRGSCEWVAHRSLRTTPHQSLGVPRPAVSKDSWKLWPITSTQRTSPHRTCQAELAFWPCWVSMVYTGAPMFMIIPALPFERLGLVGAFLPSEISRMEIWVVWVRDSVAQASICAAHIHTGAIESLVE